MGLGRFWIAATFVSVASVHMPTPIPGTEPAGYVEPVYPAETSRSGASGSAMTKGTTLPGRWSHATSYPMGNPSPLFEFIDAGDESGTILVRRVDPGNDVASLGLASEDDPATVTGEATPQARVIEDIRTLTGLSWPRIAHLVGVERQTIFRWRNDEPADEQKVQRAIEILDILNEAREEHGTGADLRAWLNRTAPMQAASPYQLLSDGRYDEVRFLAMLAPSLVSSISDLARDTSNWDRYIVEEERAYRD